MEVGISLAEHFGRVDHAGLQPVHANRLLVPGVILKPNVDIVAGFDHLLAGLRKASLVAIDRRDREQPWHEADGEKTMISTATARACEATA